MKITLIGDVHQKHSIYNKILDKDKPERTICLGDFGFQYSCLNNIDSNLHKILGGNHDNYDLIESGLYPHFLDDFGVYQGLFYIRGGFSIDLRYRTYKIDWWPQEELSLSQSHKCLALYKEIKPEIVISHECPAVVAKLIGNPDILLNWDYNPDTFTTRTQELLQECFNYHKPKQWFFGHFHRSWTKEVDGTIFRCLNELETYELEIDGTN